ncbi:TetR/AcrR family transcriptional regulator [Streptomyces sp. NPDC018029]|uniref:TetR/AcrR family transcriptional regulator n=1 Tax=Streptomyces sp. NPDC018029 TaxID=3365032 RepID=UPI00379A5852
MRTSQRKTREVAERDQALVRLALDMISRDGFHNLTLGKLAQEAGYSKGTVYNHFACREDLLIELSAESARRQLRYFQAIADLPWSGTRALYGMAFAYLHHAVVAPVLFECSITARTDAVCRTASEDRMTRRDLVESQMAQVVGFAVQRTVADGAYRNPDVPTDVAVDALRAYILGYAAMHLLSRRFLWADEEHLDGRLAVMASMMGGLGWPKLDKAELAEIHKVVVGIVGDITRDYETGR